MIKLSVRWHVSWNSEAEKCVDVEENKVFIVYPDLAVVG